MSIPVSNNLNTLDEYISREYVTEPIIGVVNTGLSNSKEEMNIYMKKLNNEEDVDEQLVCYDTLVYLLFSWVKYLVNLRKF
jgi:hypothetical protein